MAMGFLAPLSSTGWTDPRGASASAPVGARAAQASADWAAVELLIEGARAPHRHRALSRTAEHLSRLPRQRAQGSLRRDRAASGGLLRNGVHGAANDGRHGANQR